MQIIATILRTAATRDKSVFKVTIELWGKNITAILKPIENLISVKILKQFQHNESISYRVVKELNRTYMGLNPFTNDISSSKITIKINSHATLSTGIYLLKVNNKNTSTRCEICSKLAINTTKRRHWRRSGVFFVIFENISHLVLVFLLLTLSR